MDIDVYQFNSNIFVLLEVIAIMLLLLVVMIVYCNVCQLVAIGSNVISSGLVVMAVQMGMIYFFHGLL